MFNWRVLICPGLALLALGALVYLLWRVRSHHKRLLDPRRRDAVLCPHCGYDLTGMEIPRCPECGRALGFDATFEQLGIDEREVIEHVRSRPTPPSRDDAEET